MIGDRNVTLRWSFRRGVEFHVYEYSAPPERVRRSPPSWMPFTLRGLSKLLCNQRLDLHGIPQTVTNRQHLSEQLWMIDELLIERAQRFG